ncbi:MAG: hypothetical protein AAGI68_00735 [Planctomycetota bacterium]
MTIRTERHRGKGGTGGVLGVCVALGLSLTAMGCQEVRREKQRFGPPSIGGPPQTAIEGVEPGGALTRDDAGSVEDAGAEAGGLAVERPALGSFENPVKADGAAGQLAYLQRLRNAAGQRLVFRREGTFLTPGGQPLDGYRLRDPATGAEQLVFLDLHHSGYQEERALPGYQLLPSEASLAQDGG